MSYPSRQLDWTVNRDPVKDQPIPDVSTRRHSHPIPEGACWSSDWVSSVLPYGECMIAGANNMEGTGVVPVAAGGSL